MLAIHLLLPFIVSFAPAANGDSVWSEIRSRLIAGDTTVNFTEARLAYVASSSYSPYFSGTEERKQMNEAYKAANLPQFVTVCRSVLDKHPLHPEYLSAIAWAYRELEIKDSADHFTWRYYGVMESIENSGDGATVATAKVVIAVYEEYAWINEKGLKSIGQSLVTADGHACDKMKVVDASDTTHEVFFNVDLSMGYMSRLLEPKD